MHALRGREPGADSTGSRGVKLGIKSSVFFYIAGRLLLSLKKSNTMISNHDDSMGLAASGLDTQNYGTDLSSQPENTRREIVAALFS